MQKMKGISGSTLKMIAVLSMLIDHTAAVVLRQLLVDNPEGLDYRVDFSFTYISQMLQSGFTGKVYVLYLLMRNVIGRLAFPIYCFLLVEGFEKTHNRIKYAGRLFLFALISEIPFDLAFYGKIGDYTGQNVFFTLFLGFLMMWGMKKMEELPDSLWMKWVGMGACFLAGAYVAEKICCDYGANGIVAIALLFLLRRNKTGQILAGCAAFLYEVTAPAAFIFVALYNGQRGVKLKFIFYVFYPVHLMLLYILMEMLFHP
ncbi:TraX family protein [Parablautia muri]|uniref:Conjugal transfer protein TraX n=1 Tax=Parablautia muri TaxID=2320879 RepID=A0A9X5BFN0_9FIRM|nr:TraX family protein [Parablautia muri]NBJ93169.1 conjugal transfer protein TraX [Parablautia muri]